MSLREYKLFLFLSVFITSSCKKEEVDQAITPVDFKSVVVPQKWVGKWKLLEFTYEDWQNSYCQYANQYTENAEDHNLLIFMTITEDGWLIYNIGDSIERTYKLSKGSTQSFFYVNGTKLSLSPMSFPSNFEIGDSCNFFDFFMDRFNYHMEEVAILNDYDLYIKVE